MHCNNGATTVPDSQILTQKPHMAENCLSDACLYVYHYY